MVTAEDVARQLKVTTQTVKAWARKKVIPAYKVGGSWRFKEEEVQGWLRSRKR